MGVSYVESLQPNLDMCIFLNSFSVLLDDRLKDNFLVKIQLK